MVVLRGKLWSLELEWGGVHVVKPSNTHQNACMLREQQLNEAERMRKVHNEPCRLRTVGSH